MADIKTRRQNTDRCGGWNFLKHSFQPRSWEWIGNKYFVCRERCLSSTGKKIISREIINHTDKGVIADQFYSENLYSKGR
ncbi:MAG: hypothetical protein H0W62_08495 [Chitinophagales bacterium]|nr:hypothetical protein [Chitinophagales bacterium]